MVLDIRQAQADSIVGMLHLHAQQPGAAALAISSPVDDSFKVLILDQFTKDILAPLVHINELRKHGVTLHMMLESERQPIPDVPAVYFVQATDTAIDRITTDAARGLYDTLHLNFATQIPRTLMERLASMVVGTGAAARIARVVDQHANFISLESGMFSLGISDTYLLLNDPKSLDTSIESAVNAVVDGLFCVLATMGVVPLIRCPSGGAAEHVAAKLDARLRDAMRDRTNIFTKSLSGAGLAASLQRPLLCLFDRTFELSVALQHTWTYKPLVHDVLGMRLNRIAGGGLQDPSKSYEVDESTDFFWRAHGREQFPRIAELVEAELGKYKAAVEELNRTTGANVDPSADPADLMSASTKGLISAVSSLPELTERKRVIDKHTNLATLLLKAIKDRGLDQFYALEEDLISGKAEGEAVISRLAAMAGSPVDRLRLALVWLLTATNVPSESECQKIELALEQCGADMAAWSYVKRMRRMNLTGKSAAGMDGQFGSAAQSQLTNLLGSTFGSGLSSLTKGVKSLLAGEQQTAVTVAVESLMDGKPSPDTDGYLIFDPKAPLGRAQRPAGGFKEAIVFIVGGGNYLEAESLVCWAARAVPTPKNVIYGATELLTGEEFVGQLAELGRRSGALN